MFIVGKMIFQSCPDEKPKAEIRMPKEIRDSNPTHRRWFEAFFRESITAPQFLSDFKLRASFGCRISDFGFICEDRDKEFVRAGFAPGLKRVIKWA